MRKIYEELAIQWLCRAFEQRRGMTTEDCLDQAVNCLRMAALTPSPQFEGAKPSAAQPDPDVSRKDPRTGPDIDN